MFLVNEFALVIQYPYIHFLAICIVMSLSGVNKCWLIVHHSDKYSTRQTFHTKEKPS